MYCGEWCRSAQREIGTVSGPGNLFISCIFKGIYVHGLFCFAGLSWWPLREVHNKLTKQYAALLPFISTLARLTTIIATRS
jgi:hypothetical protein